METNQKSFYGKIWKHFLLFFFFAFSFSSHSHSVFTQSNQSDLYFYFVLLHISLFLIPCGAVRTRHCFVLCSAMLSCVGWNDIAAGNCSSCHRFKPFKLIFQEHFSLSLCIFEHRFGSFSSLSFFRVFYSCKKHRLWSAYMQMPIHNAP